MGGECGRQTGDAGSQHDDVIATHQTHVSPWRCLRIVKSLDAALFAEPHRCDDRRPARYLVLDECANLLRRQRNWLDQLLASFSRIFGMARMSRTRLLSHCCSSSDMPAGPAMAIQAIGLMSKPSSLKVGTLE